MKRSLFFGAAMLLAGSLAFAKPAMRGTRTITQPDGTSINIRIIGDENMHFTLSEDGSILHRDANGFYQFGRIDSDGAIVPSNTAVNISEINMEMLRANRKSPRRAPQTGLGLVKNTYPNMGSPKGLIILVEYSDVKFNDSYDGTEYFNDMINGENFAQYGGTGSARAYFKEQSGGKFIPSFDVYGPITLPQQQSYYGKNDRYGNDTNPAEMVTDALDILDPAVDFSQYDTDGDGLIDNIYIFYAGQGEASYGDENTVWPHSWDVRYEGITKWVDGVQVANYACSNEWERNKPDGLGTFVHEFSHVMGLPDLYNTEDPTALYTPGDYSVLDSGNYLNDSRTPPNYSAYEKNAMGWYEPIMLDGPMSVTLQEISSGDFGLIPTSKTFEFFLLENRQLTGWDKYLPNHGMLIWHIDYVENVFMMNEVNNTKNHQYVDIVEANNSPNYINAKGFTFPGTSRKTEFSSSTRPALQEWSGGYIDLPITGITESDGLISFDVAGGAKGSTGRVEILDGHEEAPIYYNMQGMLIKNPQAGTLVIEKLGDKTFKKIIR